jgi:iron complex transport system permease protein
MLLLCVLVLIVVAPVAVLLGAGDLGWQRVLGELTAQLTGGRSPLSGREAAIIWQLRVPRVLLAGLAGAALAGAGPRSRACSAIRSPIRICSAPPRAPGWRGRSWC